jgi:hypothetical protein
VEAVTGFDGTLKVRLQPGTYRMRSAEALEFEGKKYSWEREFVVRAAETTTLELSNDNAAVAAGGPASERAGGFEAGDLYERFRGSVFKIVMDSGHGSGFLVASEGLILTNHHVIVDATYLAAKVDERHKYAVSLLAQDAEHDLAVLRIHPDAIRDHPLLPLAGEGLQPAAISVGERVVAIGSPLTTEAILTEGIVSKVQPDTLTSDVNINPGNSGGPLLNRKGQVVGVCTYTMGEEGGPGLSGVTRIHVAGKALAAAREAMSKGEPPPARMLPMEAEYRFPPEEVRKAALARSPQVKDYHLEAGKIDVQFFTPVLVVSGFLERERLASEERQKRKNKGGEKAEAPAETGKPYYAWQKEEEIFLPVVRIRAFPEVKMTPGSMFVAGLLGTGGKFRFKTDFERMELRRGDAVIEPILPGRIKEVVSTPGLTDIGYWGMYEYPPEAFKPGAPITLRIWEEGIAEPRTIPLPDKLLEQLREDYRPYLEAAGAQAPAKN